MVPYSELLQIDVRINTDITTRFDSRMQNTSNLEAVSDSPQGHYGRAVSVNDNVNDSPKSTQDPLISSTFTEQLSDEEKLGEILIRSNSK